MSTSRRRNQNQTWIRDRLSRHTERAKLLHRVGTLLLHEFLDSIVALRPEKYDSYEPDSVNEFINKILSLQQDAEILEQEDAVLASGEEMLPAHRQQLEAQEQDRTEKTAKLFELLLDEVLPPESRGSIAASLLDFFNRLSHEPDPNEERNFAAWVGSCAALFYWRAHAFFIGTAVDAVLLAIEQARLDLQQERKNYFNLPRHDTGRSTVMTAELRKILH